MNQPPRSCFDYSHEVVSLANELKNYKKQHRPQQSIDSEKSILAMDTEDTFMDCNTMDDGAGSGRHFVQEYDGAAIMF